MVRKAWLAVAIALVLGRAANGDPKGLSVWVEADGSSFLWNPTDLPISFDGFTLSSETNGLDPVGWTSIADQVLTNPGSVIAALGAGALSFGEANPNVGNISELNLANAGTIGPHAKFPMGKPFATLPPYYAEWDYKLSGVIGGGPPGEIVYAPDMPEPSTFVLAALAGLGLLACHRGRAGFERRR